jgi:hypothetical protein
MSVIHMETENVREAARRIDLVVAELYYKPGSLKNTASELQGAWEGGQASRFARDIRRQADLLQREVVNLQRLAAQARREVDEWEQADGSASFDVYLPGTAAFIGGAGLFWPAPIEPDDSKVSFTWGAEGGIDGHLIGSDGKTDAPLGVEAKIGVEGALFDAEDAHGDFMVGGVDIGGMTGDMKAASWEAGAKFGYGEDGFTAGVYGEYDSWEASGTAVVGTGLFGLAIGGAVTAGSVEGFAGIKDNSLGASIGGSLVGAEVEVGLNVAGANVGVQAGISAGIEFGIKIGADTEVKVGPFKIGLTFGAAKTA